MDRPRVTRRTLLPALAAVLVLVLVIVGLTLWRRLDRTDLQRALDVVPASSLRVGFTDWALVRTTQKAELGRRPSGSKVQAFVDHAYDSDFTAASSIDESAGALQRYYGFSPANARWEAYAQSRSGATMVLKLDDADFDTLRDNLRELGYRKPKEDDGVWRGGIDLVAQLDPTLSPELQYVALLEGQGLVVASDESSYAAEAVKAAQGSADSLGDEDGTGPLTDALGEPANAMVWSRDFACDDLAMSRADTNDQKQADQLVAAAGGVSPLTGLAMGMAPDRSLHVVQEFADDGQAAKNLRPRAKLAVGEAVGRAGSFSDDFRLTSSTSDGRTVRLTLEPRAKSGYVLSSLDQGPVLFATC